MTRRKNPVVLPIAFTVTSVVVAVSRWSDIPEKVPLWWSAHAHPLVYGPRWLGLFAFPFLQLVIPYILYQVACHDQRLQRQSGEAANAVANIIALPSVLLFSEYVMAFLPSISSSSMDFLPRPFTANLAIWGLFWLGYNLRHVEPNSSIGVPTFVPLSRADVWARAHRRSGFTLMAFGILLFIFSLACPIGLGYMIVSLIIWPGSYALVLLDSYMICTIEKSALVRAGTLYRQGRT